MVISPVKLNYQKPVYMSNSDLNIRLPTDLSIYIGDGCLFWLINHELNIPDVYGA
jgi:hypothetical protein